MRETWYPYVILHDADCGCLDREPYLAPTARAVALFLWGRDVAAHGVYTVATAWRFREGDIDRLETTLLYGETAP